MNTDIGLRWAAIVNQYPNQEAIHQGDRSITYRQLAAQVSSYANYLIDKRIYNQCIPVLIADTSDHIVALLGIVLSGNYYCSLQPDRFQTVSDVLALVPASTLIAPNNHFALGTTSVSVLQQCMLPAPYVSGPMRYVAYSPDMGFCLFMTSGSTGQPKQVIHSHQSILSDIDRQIRDNQIGPTDRIDLLFSLEFSASLACIFPALLTGATLVIHDLKKAGVLTLPTFWQQQRITFSTLSVSTLRLLLTSSFDFTTLTKLRLLSVGAEPVAQRDVVGFQQRFAAHTVLQIAYATTETRTISEHKIRTTTPWSDHITSVGKPVPGRTVRIRAESGQWLEEPEQIGEIVVQAPYIPHEYANDPAATRRAYSRLPDKAVQYATGDLGYVDANGYIVWCGRTDFMVKLNGQKVNLLHLEAELEQAPGVGEVAVVCDTAALPRPVITAFLSTEPFFNQPALKHWLAERLPPVMMPDAYQIVNALPRTRTGKVDRPELLRQHQATRLLPVPATLADLSTSLMDTIKQVWATELKRTEPIADYDDFFRDLGGDSLTAEACLAALEDRVGQPLIMQLAFSYTTPRALASFIDTPPATGVQCISLNPSQSERPHIYFIPPLEGDRRVYQVIENALADQANLYSIFYDPFSPAGILRSVADLADAILPLIDNASSNWLVGYSFGGILAYEVATRLDRTDAPGHLLNRLVLLDTPLYRCFPLYRVVVKDIERTWKRLVSGIRTGEAIPWKTGIQVMLTRYRSRISKTNQPTTTETADWKRKAEVWTQTYSRLINVNAPVHRTIVLIRATDTSFFEREIKPDYNWQPYTTAGVDEYLLAAHHTQVLNPSNSREIARILLRILNDSVAESNSPELGETSPAH